MAKGQMRSNKETRKPKADAKKKSAGLNSSQAEPVPTRTEPSEMYKLFTKGRSIG
jgi:hypothetical protein